MEFWQNLKKRITDHDFPPPFIGAENIENAVYVLHFLVLRFVRAHRHLFLKVLEHFACFFLLPAVFI